MRGGVVTFIEHGTRPRFPPAVASRAIPAGTLLRFLQALCLVNITRSPDDVPGGPAPRSL